MTTNKICLNPEREDTPLKSDLAQTFFLRKQLETVHARLDHVEDQLRALPSSSGFSSSGVRVSSSAHEAHFEYLVEKKTLLESEAVNLQHKLERKEAEIVQLIRRYASSLEGDILFSRYVENHSWSEIAHAYHFSERHARRLHDAGLKQILSAGAVRIAG